MTGNWVYCIHCECECQCECECVSVIKLLTSVASRCWIRESAVCENSTAIECGRERERESEWTDIKFM